MTEEQVSKSIGQMRSIFALWGIGALLVIYQMTLIVLSNDSTLGPAVVMLFLLVGIGLAVCFWGAFVGLGRRSERGYLLARICSIVLLLGFPIWTYFGYSYLKKLKTPSMKDAFQVA